MSNQSVDGFQGSQPFITDKQFQNLSLDEIRHIIAQEKEGLKKDYSELEQRKRLIKQYKKLVEARNKVKQGIDIKKKLKKKAPIKTTGPSIKKKIKSFDEYFEECIKNKKIPKDTPSYLREALERAMKEYDQGLERERSALEGFANKYTIQGIPGLVVMDFFEDIKQTLIDFFTYHRNIKFKMILVCLMEKQGIQQNVGVVGLEEGKAYFVSNTGTNLKSDDVEDSVYYRTEDILARVEVYQEAQGSGWYFKEVEKLEIHTVEFNPAKGSSYIPLPGWISNKKAIVNIQNKDDKCFLWCILRYLYPKERDEHRLKDLEKYEFSLNTKGITFPMELKDITKFEKLNPDLPGINVFSYENMTIYPLRMADRDCLNTIDLFLIEEDGNSHYTLIKNFNRLLRSQKTKSKDGEIFICKKCFTHYTKQELLEKHIRYCSSNETVAVKMPEPNTMLYFKNYHKQLPIPFVVYADFECFTKPMNSCSPNPKDSYNYNYQKHEPSGFCIFIKGVVDKKIKPIVYSKTEEDEDIAKIFVEKLTEATRGIYNDFYRRPKPLILSKDEQKSFDKAEFCHICNKELLEDKVRDHCHFTGQYRGAAHNSCNLNCRKPLVLPVIFHNLQGYDAHLFIKQLATLPGDLNCIPSTEEKYISFSKKIKVDEYRSKKTGQMMSLYFEIRFIDSFKFLQTSLANLVSNLQPCNFHNTKREFKKNVDLLTRKGVYPYDYVSSLEKLSETQLPPKEEFYSKLNDEDITEDDYQHAINVWNTFKCKSLRDYHDLYLKPDVLLLSDVFENFRKTCFVVE